MRLNDQSVHYAGLICMVLRYSIAVANIVVYYKRISLRFISVHVSYKPFLLFKNEWTVHFGFKTTRGVILKVTIWNVMLSNFLVFRGKRA
jgi:hypothetical protein